MSFSGLFRVAAATASDAVRQEVGGAVRRAALLVAALVLFAGAVVFAELALYLWLRTQTAPHLAALIVCGVTLLVMLVVILFATAGRSGRRHARGPDATFAAASLGEAHNTAAADPVARLAAEAEALGAIIGKDAKGYELVLGAFLVGMLLGRGR